MIDTNKPIKNSSMTDAAVAIAAILTSSYQRLGYRFDPNYPLDEMAVDVFNMLRERHPNVSIEQVNKAVSNGINGDYGEVKGLAPVDVVRFVKEYTQPSNMLNYQAPEEEQPKMLNRDVKTDTINLMQSLYDSYLNDKPIVAIPPCGFFITLLWEHNLLLNIKKPTVQQQYIASAREAIKREKLGLINKFPHLRKNFEQDINNLTDKTIKEKAYKLVVLDFFKDCKEMDIKDLHELFNN